MCFGASHFLCHTWLLGRELMRGQICYKPLYVLIGIKSGTWTSKYFNFRYVFVWHVSSFHWLLKGSQPSLAGFFTKQVFHKSKYPHRFRLSSLNQLAFNSFSSDSYDMNLKIKVNISFTVWKLHILLQLSLLKSASLGIVQAAII